MPTPERKTAEVLAEWHEQNRALLEQVKAMRTTGRTQPRWRPLVVSCEACRTIVLEVWATQPYRSLRVRVPSSFSDGASWSLSALPNGAEKHRDAGHGVTVRCQCKGPFRFGMAALYDALDRGEASVSLASLGG